MQKLVFAKRSLNNPNIVLKKDEKMKSLILSVFTEKKKNNVVDRSPQGDRELTFVILTPPLAGEESRFYAVWEKRFFVLRTQNDNPRSASPDLSIVRIQ